MKVFSTNNPLMYPRFILVARADGFYSENNILCNKNSGLA